MLNDGTGCAGMIDKWVWNYDKTELVNTHHIVSLKREAPALAQKDYIVYAVMTYGTKIMYRGNRDDCISYMDDFWEMQMEHFWKGEQEND